MGRTTFFDNMGASLKGLDPERYEPIAHSVLHHLWRRLPLSERQNLLGALPEELRDLVAEPMDPSEPVATMEQHLHEGPVEAEDIVGFLQQIRQETGLNAEDNRDQEAVRAVFDALKAELPEHEVMHIREMLPTGVKPMWAGA